jgi:hypothetical protein
MRLPTPVNELYLNRYKSLLEHYTYTSDYPEIHHICPKSLGGRDSPDNLISIPSRVHFVAHWMLWKAYQTDELAYAFWAMCHQKKRGQENRYTKINSKTYEILKKRRSIVISNSNTNRWKNKEWAEKMKATMRKAATTPVEKERRSKQAILTNNKHKTANSNSMKTLWANDAWASEQRKKFSLGAVAKIKPVIVDGIEYPLVLDVAKKYRISISTVRQRIRSNTPQFSGWMYAPPAAPPGL